VSAVRALDVQIQHVAGCPNRAEARRRVDVAIRRTGVAAHVTEVAVGGDALFGGSPTVLVDGDDAVTDVHATEVGSARCRLYLTDRGVEGAPSVGQLMASLLSHTASQAT
jgi:hypothetical protein